jgi:hypothetical protein
MYKTPVFHLIVFFQLLTSNLAYNQSCLNPALFRQPEGTARPGVIWRWIGGCVTPEGIVRDMREMEKKGIGDIEHFDVAGPCWCDTSVQDQHWYNMFRLALEEAHKNNITFTKVPFAGWGIGTQYFNKDFGAKKIAFTETRITGKGKITVHLQQPTGPEGYYKEIAILAFKERKRMPVKPVNILSSHNERAGYFQEVYSPVNMVDLDPNTYCVSDKLNGPFSNMNLVFIYDVSYTFNCLYLSPVPFENGVIKKWKVRIQAIDNEGKLKPVQTFEISTDRPQKITFTPVTALKMNISISSSYNTNISIGEAWFMRDSDEVPVRNGIKWWALKSGTFGSWDWPSRNDGTITALYDHYTDDGYYDCLSRDVAELTEKMDSRGNLTWDVPEGCWTILRFGEVLVGGPSRQAYHLRPQGYEGNPYDTKTIDMVFRNSVNKMVDIAGDLTGNTFKSLLIDSWEIGALEGGFQPTWTDNFRSIFKDRYGYDLVKYLPAFANRIVDSRDITTRFFEDFRMSLAELNQKFYERFTDAAHEKGLKTSAQCGYGTMPHQHIDGLANFGRVDIPESEFWYDNVMQGKSAYCDPVRTASSAAHIYGKPVVSAESFTNFQGWQHYPEMYKLRADRAFCDGLNRIEFSVFSHQFDTNARPGVTTFESINDNLTWWEMSDNFIKYLARCSYLLQQGIHVADLAYFYGEGTLKFVPGKEYLKPEIPAGFDYDGMNAEILMKYAQVENHVLVLPSGMRYRYLVLPYFKNWTISIEMLEKIKELVEAGLTIIGNRPAASYGLVNFPANQKEFVSLCDYLWGKNAKPSGEIQIKKGKVIYGIDLNKVLFKEKQLPDLNITEANHPAVMLWTHKNTGDGDIYFLSNQSDNSINDITAEFRIKGYIPELWNPVDGSIIEAPFWKSIGPTTIVKLYFEPRRSWFVVFRKPASTSGSNKEHVPRYFKIIDLSKDWQVQFDQKLGGPKNLQSFPSLESWTNLANDSIRYYSGTAVYTKRFVLSNEQWDMLAGKDIFIDLGIVKVIARATINGKLLESAWCAPFHTKVTGFLHEGENQLEIELANTWFNRIIYDAITPAPNRITSSNENPDINSNPQESGLLGPVVLMGQEP